MDQGDKKLSQINVPCNPDTYHKVGALARYEGCRSRAELVRNLINEYLESKHREYRMLGEAFDSEDNESIKINQDVFGLED